MTSNLSACAQFGALGVGKSIHDRVIEEQLEWNMYIFTVVIDVFAKCGKLEEARRIIDEMPHKNISWNAIISSCGVHGHGRESLKLFDTLLSSYQYCMLAYISALYASSHAGLIDEGRKQEALVRPFGPSKGTWNRYHGFLTLSALKRDLQ